MPESSTATLSYITDVDTKSRILIVPPTASRVIEAEMDKFPIKGNLK